LIYAENGWRKEKERMQVQRAGLILKAEIDERKIKSTQLALSSWRTAFIISMGSVINIVISIYLNN